MPADPPVKTKVVVERDGLERIFEALRRKGYQVVGPTVRDNAIIYDAINSIADLPEGWTDEQEAGTYRLRKRNDGALFGYNAGSHTWKKFLHPPSFSLWEAKRNKQGFKIQEQKENAPKLAFIGVKPCELQAISVQDKVFMSGRYVDGSYASRRQNVFIMAVNCGQSSAACFCSSMGTGPKATSGFDLALTEVLDGGRHYFVVESGSQQGTAVIQETACEEAGVEEASIAERLVEKVAREMRRAINTINIKDVLYSNLEHPRWDEAAKRCLSCGNCTMVCPTCFCTTVEDVTDLKCTTAERIRKWDSCFTMDFSYIHGGSIRATTRARYRQWLVHKLATWIDQFGMSGCVGCGRCIVWCPVGIDITEEVAAIRG